MVGTTAKSHAYWQQRRESELNNAVQAAHVEGTLSLLLGILGSGFMSLFVPALDSLTIALIASFALFILCGEPLIAMWLEHFDKRFKV